MKKIYSIIEKSDASIHTFTSPECGTVGHASTGNKCVMSSPVSQAFKEMDALGYYYQDGDFYEYIIALIDEDDFSAKKAETKNKSELIEMLTLEVNDITAAWAKSKSDATNAPTRWEKIAEDAKSKSLKGQIDETWKILENLQKPNAGYYYRVAGCVVPLCEVCVGAYEKKCHLDDDDFAEPWEPITEKMTCRHCESLLKIETIK